MNVNKNALLAPLQQLGLSQDEAIVWLNLIEAPNTHVGIAQATGINRTTVYRLVDSLNDKSLVHELANEQGNLLEAAGPDALALLIEHDEQQLEAKRQAFQELTTKLPARQASDQEGFYIKTYYGRAGLKQMLWNELKMTTEAIMFARTTINELAGQAFADKFRGEIIARGIKQRSIENESGRDVTVSATKHMGYMDYYNVRYLSPGVLKIVQELTIHDDIVSVYNWEGDMLVGTETKNAHYANFMRQVFETYWKVAKD